jgi:hypothetical protein
MAHLSSFAGCPPHLLVLKLCRLWLGQGQNTPAKLSLVAPAGYHAIEPPHLAGLEDTITLLCHIIKTFHYKKVLCLFLLRQNSR